MRRRHIAMLSASLIGLAALPAPAAAQHIDRIVTFGDSYADDGNFFQIAGIAPLTTQVYTTGRFTGGTNYIDTLSQILGVPVENFAIGGALTNNTNTNGPGLPGFTFEVTSFLAGGGGAVFPTVEPTFDEGDLVTVSIGGNDSRRYQSTGGTVAGAAAAAAASVASAEANLDRLVAAGAPTISFLAGDASTLPEVGFLADPAGAAAVRSAFSTSFNSGIQDVLAGYADSGVIVHYLDLNLIVDRIAADPAAYGLTGLACPAFPPPVGPATPPGNTICAVDAATASQYLIYGDQLHPTSAGSEIIARYVAAQLDAPLTLQAPSDLGLDISRQFGRTLSSRMDIARGREPAEGVRLFIVGDMFSRDIDTSPSNQEFEDDGVGVTVGAETMVGGLNGGIALNYTRSQVDFRTNVSRVKSNSWQIGGYAGYSVGGLFIQGHAGYGKDEHKIRRAGVIDDLAAKPDGTHYTLGAKAGYLIGLDGLIAGLRVGPVIAIDHASAKVDDYSEKGDAALSLSVSDQELKSTTGQLGLEGRLSLIEGVRSHASITMEREMTGDGRLILFAQNSAPTIVNQWNVERDKQSYGRLSSGNSIDLWQGATLNTAISSTIGRKGGQEFGLQLGFNMGF